MIHVLDRGTTSHLYGSPNHPTLFHVLETFKQLLKDRGPNEIIHMAVCEPYAEMKKDVKKQRPGSAKSTHLADNIIQKILETNIMNAQDWEDIIYPDFRLKLIKGFGLTVDSYIQKLIRVVRSQRSETSNRKVLPSYSWRWWERKLPRTSNRNPGLGARM
jgi:hypothetical protein